jgi:hypothetical protein
MVKQGVARETPILIQRLCFYTSLDYLISKQAKHGKVYEHMGKAVVTDSHIYYRSDDVKFDIPITSIVEIRIGTFYRYHESAQLNYLALTYAVSGDQKTVLFVPTESTLTPQWKTNKIIENWYNTITQLKTRTYKKSDKGTSVEKKVSDTGKQSIVSSENDDDYWDFKPSPISEKFSFSKLSLPFKILFSSVIIILSIILAAFTYLQGQLGLIVGIMLMVVILVPLYYFFYIQFQIRMYIHKNREKNILFNMWTELEEEPVLGPFKANK